MTDSPLVVDASVLAQIYVRDQDEQFTAEAERLVREHVGGVVELVAPHFIYYEIPSAIHRAVRRRRLDPGDARAAMTHFFNLGVRTVGGGGDVRLMVEAAFGRAAELGCHLYDALYLIVAEALDFAFITADRKLYQRIRDRVDYAIWIQDYQPATPPPHEG